jgi:hypothetical protein
MVLQASGLISLSNIKSEFTGVDPVELSDYYRGGIYVPNITLNANVPTSGSINLQNFYGATIATFNISPNVSTVNEGGTVRFDVITSNFSGTLYWSILGSVTNSDFSSPLNAVTSGGTLTVEDNYGQLDLTTSADLNTEGSESFFVRLKALSTSGPVVTQSANVIINDTSTAPFYVNLTRSDSTILAPNNITFTLTSNGIPNGRTVGYTITGIQADDLSSGSLTGNFTINNNTATVTLGIDSFIGELFFMSSTTQMRRIKANATLSTLGTSIQQTRALDASVAYFYWRPDGTRLFAQNYNTETFEQYNLTRPFDLTTATKATSKFYDGAITSPLGLWISSSGLTTMVLDTVDRRIYRVLMGTAWDAGTLGTYTHLSGVLPLTTYRGLDLSPNGVFFYTCAVSTGSVHALRATTAFRPDTILTTPVEDWNPPAPTTPTGIRFNSNGSALYLTDGTSSIHYYTLSTPYTLSTASLVTSASVSSIIGGALITDVYWNNIESETLTITTASNDSGFTSLGLPKSNATIITN